MRFTILLFLFFVSACASKPPPDTTPLALKRAAFSQLPGWGRDDLTQAAAALQKSCTRIVKADPARAFGPIPQAGTYGDWQRICDEFARMQGADTGGLQSFFERHFQPWEASAAGHEEGLFTGYYEASLHGSRTRGGPYRYPLYARPDDLVMVDLGAFREELKGQRIAGRVDGGNLKPYEDRAAIVAGNWPHNDKALVWVDDPVDAFFVQVQGSGVVELDDGSIMRLGYAGQNGHIYYAIGRELVKRGELSKEDVSMQSIHAWLAAHPDRADEVMNTNRSYVFFEEKNQGATGGEGVVLTAGRSLAIDRSKIPYGIPVWLDAKAPEAFSHKYGAQRIQKLMMAQDTGGAIRGAVRGDVYWGYGDEAEHMAGGMKSQGRYWLLLPK